MMRDRRIDRFVTVLPGLIISFGGIHGAEIMNCVVAPG